MSMRIEDGKGSGHTVEVDDENRLKTFSVIEPEDKHRNREGYVWSVLSSTTAVGTEDYVFYYKNTGTATVSITDIRMYVGAASTISIDKVSGTPSYAAGVALTPVNRNLGSSNAPTATIYEDTNTTGLTNEGTIFFQRCGTADVHYHLSTSANIIIPQGQAIAMRTSTATLVTILTSILGLKS